MTTGELEMKKYNKKCECEWCQTYARYKEVKANKDVDKLLSLVDDKGFIDSFKGVFIEKKYDVDLEEIKKYKQLLST